MKIVKPEQTEHYIDKLSDVLDRKANIDHRHAKVNGLSVVIADTAPTVNDENLLTLVVDTAFVPVVGGLSAEMSGIYTKYFSLNGFFNMPEAHFMVQAYFDGDPVSALYQVERSDTVVTPFSSNRSFDLLVGSTLKIRVKYGDYEKLFDVSVADPDQSEKEARLPYLAFSDNDSGFYKNGEAISGAMTYVEASSGVRLVWKYNEGFDGSDFSTMTVSRAFDSTFSGSETTVGDLISEIVTEPRGTATIGTTEAYFDLTDTFTEDDIQDGTVYTMETTASDGTYYYAMFSHTLKDVPSSESFVGNVSRCAFNSSYTNDTTNDNKLTHVSSSYSAAFFCFNLEKEFTYDIEIRLTDNSGVPLQQSTKVPFNTCPEVITVEAGSKTKSPYCGHKIGTAGTYYVIANVTGVGTDYEQDILIELTVT